MSCLRCGCRGHTESRCAAPSTAHEQQEEQEEQEEIDDSDFPSLPISEAQANIAPVAEVIQVAAATEEAVPNTQVEEREVQETTVRDLQARVAALEEEIAAIRGIFGGLSTPRR